MKVHLSGIIPIANNESEIDSALPHVLLPIGNGISLIQRSVFECALAGCDTIWIVANDDMAPAIRKTIGDWVYDPVYYKRELASKYYSELRKEIPIYYVAIHPKDRGRRDSYGWSVIHGIHTAYMTSYRISKWIAPEKYFISFPFGVYDPHIVRSLRRSIRSKKKNFFLTNNKNSIKDNIPLSFTMTGEDFKICRQTINQMTTREYLPPLPDQQYPSQKLPLSQRWSAKSFDLAKIFQNVNFSDADSFEIEEYYDVSTWDQYVSCLSCLEIKRPPDYLTKAHKHVKIPYTEGEQ